MWAAIRSSWPLFVGMAFLMISHGLLATLLTLRATALGFGDFSIGLMQSAYPVGSLLGCLIVPRLIMRVGHVRIFAALASLASTAALIHLVTIDLWSWGAMRLLSGICFSGLYIVAESWLNGRVNNENRGGLLSIYFVIQTGGLTIGQLLLNFSSPEDVLLFIVVSVLISLSLIPMLVSTSSVPPYQVPERISLWKLFHLSPMGLTGSFLNGISQTVLYVVLALYGSAIGLPAGSIGWLIGFMSLGGMLFQFPLGKLSDHIDRRLLIVGAPGLAIPLCLFLAQLDDPASNTFLLFATMMLIGGLTLPIYSICMAHMNDHLNPAQMVAASGMLVLTVAAGMIFGPTLGAIAIEYYGPEGMFYLLSILATLTAMTGLFRLWSGQPYTESHTKTVAMTSTATPQVTNLIPEAASRDKAVDT